MTDLRTSVVIDLTGNLTRRAQQYGSALTGFSDRGQRDLGRVSMAAQGVGRNLDSLAARTTAIVAGAGAAYAGYRQIVDAGQLDKQLIQIRQTAGATAEQAAGLRKELFLMATATGQSIESLLGGFNNLIQAGQSWDQALATTRAINPAMAVTGSRAETLAAALAVAGEAFEFDLSKAETSIDVLDRMTKAGRLGNAELEDLSSIFGRVGINAKAAGLQFDETLGLIERLSMIERNPERLATLVDSTLRIFTNQKYLDKASTATGISFYNAEGDRRAALDVLDDISTAYQKFTTQAQKDNALSQAFGEVDLDTLRGLRVLLSPGTLSQARTMATEIATAGGTIAKDLPDAIANSVDQVSRLKAVLREAADGFAQPITKTVSDSIKVLIDSKADGGLGLTGEQLLGGGAATILGGALLLKSGGKLLGKLGSLGAGVAVGKGLEELAGVQPVYVVNMPSGGFMSGGLGDRFGGPRPGRTGGPLPGSQPGRLPGNSVPRLPGTVAPSTAGRLGSLAMGAGDFIGNKVVPLAAAGAFGWSIGEYAINPLLKATDTQDDVGKFVASLVAALGNKEAQRALRINDGDSDFENSGSRRRRERVQLDISIKDDRVSIKAPRTENTDADVSGSSMVGGGA